LDFLFIRLVPVNLIDMTNISKQPGKYTKPTALLDMTLDSKSGNIYEKEAGFCYGNGVS